TPPCGWEITWIRGSAAAAASAIARVASVEPSSTSTTSHPACVCARTESSVSSSVAAALCAGMMMETFIAALRLQGCTGRSWHTGRRRGRNEPRGARARPRGPGLVETRRAHPRREVEDRRQDRAGEFGRDQPSREPAGPHEPAHEPRPRPGDERETRDRRTRDRPVPCTGDQVRAEAAAVVEELAPERTQVATVVVPDDAGRLVDRGVAPRDDAVEHVQIAAAAGGRPHVERRVERADRVEDLPPERHVRATPDRVRPEQARVPELAAAEDPAREAVRHPSVLE